MAIFRKKVDKKPKTEREKVEERREEVLAQGRKFKYPMQYAKHKLVFNTVIIAVIAMLAMVIVGWAMLYQFQNTSDMIYRVTQIVPVPVAEVAGKKVRYSDYLMIYRSNLQSSEQQDGQLGNSQDDDYVRQAYKQSAMSSAVEYTYAMKVAQELGITVSEQEIDEAFDMHRKVGGVERTEETFLKIVRDNFGMSRSEYRRMLYLTLVHAKVAQAIDTQAQEVTAEIEEKLKANGGDLAAVGAEMGEAVEFEQTGQLVSNMNVDGGRADAAMKLEVGQVSEKFLSTNGDGYYFVKLIDKNETQVNYVSVKVKFSQFDQQVLQLYEDGEVKEFIEI